MVTCGHVKIFYDVYISLLTSVLWSCIQKVIVPILIHWQEYIIFTLLSGLGFSDNRKKLPKYAQISRLPLQYKLKWSMMKDFSSENNWTNFAVSVRKTLHVFDLLSILTTLTWSSTFPLDFAILFKLWIFVVKQRNWLKTYSLASRPSEWVCLLYVHERSVVSMETFRRSGNWTQTTPPLAAASLKAVEIIRAWPNRCLTVLNTTMNPLYNSSQVIRTVYD